MGAYTPNSVVVRADTSAIDSLKSLEDSIWTPYGRVSCYYEVRVFGELATPVLPYYDSPEGGVCTIHSTTSRIPSSGITCLKNDSEVHGLVILSLHVVPCHLDHVSIR